jgi:hypothetical protein
MCSVHILIKLATKHLTCHISFNSFARRKDFLLSDKRKMTATDLSRRNKLSLEHVLESMYFQEIENFCCSRTKDYEKCRLIDKMHNLLSG